VCVRASRQGGYYGKTALDLAQENRTRATAAIGNSGGPSEEPPEPIVVDGADHWEVECVLAEQTKDRRRFVLVKWLGFDITSATWEPIANIPEQFIRQYRELVHQ